MALNTEKPSTKIPSGKLRTFESFNSPSFRLFFGSLLGQWLIYSMQNVVNTLLLYRLTNSAFLVGILAIAYYTPVLLFSVLGGAIADRISKKYLLILSRLITGSAMLIVALGLTFGYLDKSHTGSWWILIFSTFLNGTSMSFVQPATMAILPELVKKEQIMNAISLTSSGQTIFRFVGPIMAGLLIDNFGFSIVYYIMVCVALIAAAVTVFMPRGVSISTRTTSTLGDTLGSFKYLWKESIFLFITIFALCHMIGGIPYLQLLPVFTESILKVSATKLGILNSASSIGSLVITLVLSSVTVRKRGVWMLFSGILTGLAVVAFAYTGSWYLSLFLVMVAGLGMTLHATTTTSLIQSYAAPDYRARMQSFYYMAQGLAGFGTFIASIMSMALGLQMALALTSAFLVISSAIMWIFVPKLRKLD